MVSREEARGLCGRPGRFEGLSAFECWLCENVDELADDSAGDVGSPFGWFARVGRFVVVTDDRGFWFVTRFGSSAEADRAFKEEEENFYFWGNEEE